MDADDVAKAFEKLKSDGKVRHFGVSNFLPHQFDLLQSRLSVPLVTNQIEISILHLDPFFDGQLDHMQKLRIVPMAWSPIGGGSLFAQGKRQDEIRKVLEEVSEEILKKKRKQFSIDILALAWLLLHPCKIRPILGTTSISRLEESVKALEAKDYMTREHWYRILNASQGKELP